MDSYREAIEYLNTFTDFEKTGFSDMKGSFNLDRLEKVLESFGRPDRAYRSIHVAGTKGKGSICTYTASILQASGYNVGLFSSPHLFSPLERIKKNGIDIAENELASILSEVKEYLAGDDPVKLTYFEVLTLMAIFYFKNKKIDFAVFETGLGGRLDATNVISPEVVCISPVSYDHMEVLGNDLADIAKEKAAIIKKDTVCISSPQIKEVSDIIEKRCGDVGAAYYLVGRDIKYDVKRLDTEGSEFDLYTGAGTYAGLKTSMPGEFQVENCAAAAAICENAAGGENLVEKDIAEGVRAAFIPGRMEILSQKPVIMIDGAQNRASAGKLKYSIEQIMKYDRLILLLGVCRDKDVQGICRELVPFADHVVFTKANVERAMDPFLMRGYVKGKPVSVTSDVKEALGIALHEANERDLILATGSFYIISEVRRQVLGVERNT